MKESEFDNYGIRNPDGKSENPSNIGKIAYSNDESGYIAEDFTRGVKETSSVQEEFYTPPKTNAPKAAAGKAAPVAAQPGSNGINVNSVVSSVGSGIGAAVGVVATAVAAAVVVVTVILSILSVNISLVLADTDRLVFQMEVEVEETEGDVKGEMPAFTATLEGKDGFKKEQTVIGNCVFSFEGLEPNQEYFLTVKGQDGKIYANQSYCTAAVPKKTVFLEVGTDGDEVFIFLSGVELGKNQIYTVTAKDDAGKTLFAADGTKESAEYSFRLERPTGFFVLVRVGNDNLAAYRVEAASPVYSYADAVWDWTDDGDLTVTVPAQSGEPLVLFPEVSSVESLAATCEETGLRVFSAEITDEDGQIYYREKTVELPALGHSYGDLFAAVPASCEEEGSIAYYCCARCERFFNEEKEEISEEDLVIPEKGHDFGTLSEFVPASCEETGVLPYYKCARCER